MIRMDELLGVSRAIAVVREQAQQLLARGQTGHRLPPILLQGETGTGERPTRAAAPPRRAAA